MPIPNLEVIMITSERQLKAAKEKIKSLKESIAKMQKKKKSVLAKSSLIQTEALLHKIEGEVAEYEALLTKGLEAIEIKSPEDIMLLPIRYRIAKHLSREDFSKEVDVPVRMIARYETSGYTNINGETFRKILHNLPLKFNGFLKEA